MHSGAYELVSSHQALRGRSQGLTVAAVILTAGALALVTVILMSGGGLENFAASQSLIRRRDALLGGPPAPSRPPAETRSEGNLAAGSHSLAALSKVQSLAQVTTRVIFSKEAQTQQIQAFIDSGHMKCCVRDNNDLQDEVYPKFYNDFPMDPVCIPGYRKDGDACIACDEGFYCPAKEDQMLQCPPQTWAPLASGEVTECWCAAGHYGKDPSKQTGADCHACPADTFCPGTHSSYCLLKHTPRIVSYTHMTFPESALVSFLRTTLSRTSPVFVPRVFFF